MDLHTECLSVLCDISDLLNMDKTHNREKEVLQRLPFLVLLTFSIEFYIICDIICNITDDNY